MAETISIRRATVADAAIIGQHRGRMFYDMGEIPVELLEEFVARSTERLREQLTSGEYVGWLAALPTTPATIIGARAYSCAECYRTP